MREYHRGHFVSEEFIQDYNEAYHQYRIKVRQAKKQAKAEARAKLEEAYKNGEKKRKRFWFF